jgi:hypothetical protein
MSRRLVGLLAALCGKLLMGSTSTTETPYPNELQGFKLYRKFLAPLRPGSSVEEAVRQVLGDTTAVKRNGWTIQPFYTTMGDPVSNSTLGPLSHLELVPDALIPFGAVHFPPAFKHCHVMVSEVNVIFDVYGDRFGLEYWLHPQDHHLIRIVYGSKRRPYPPHTFC